MSRFALGLAVAVAAVLPIAADPAAAKPKPHTTTYAVIGDTPYGDAMLAAFPAQVAQINDDPAVELVMHLGDIKSGSSRCDTSYFDTIRSNFDRFEDPLLYTPGDNEWTDCHRGNNGGYQPAGPIVPGAPVVTAGPSRLDEVRRIFFDRPGRTLGQQSRRVQAQRAPFVENTRWSDERVVVAELNVPGSNNDLAPWFGAAQTDGLKAAQAEEFARRNQANLRWLDETFLQAFLTNAPGIALGIQADMWDPAITGDPAGYSGYAAFVKRLALLTKLYHRPVLLLNGDSHIYEADHPLADATAINNTIYGVDFAVPNLSRVTVNGSADADEYLRLTIDGKSKSVFSFERVPFATTG